MGVISGGIRRAETQEADADVQIFKSNDESINTSVTIYHIHNSYYGM